MPVSFGLVYPLWTFAADGGALLERAVGEVGIDHVTVPAITGPVTAFRPVAAPDAPYFHSDGGWHYPPEARCYGGLTPRPPRARWQGTADPLARLATLVERLGIALVLRVDLRAVTPLATAAPHLALRNAWGQECTEAGLCAVGVETRDWLRAALEDLQRYQPARLELGDWRVDVSAHPVMSPQRWSSNVAELGALCFCPSCRAVASEHGLDVEVLARNVRSAVAAWCAGAPNRDVPLPEGVVAYREVRRAAVAAWLRGLLDIHAAAPGYVLTPWGSGQPPGLLPDRSVLRLDGEQSDLFAPSVLRHLEGALAMVAGVCIPLPRPAVTTGEELVVGLRTLAQRTTWIEFEGLDEAAAEALIWLRQAVRYARREQ
ncbi:MAG: hypothetical protein IPM18_10685 [Phycisphaerales bacterium]|nr:hypothetical protein [Phycisphaerales bacterium]